jgi:hypothetical protein
VKRYWIFVARAAGLTTLLGLVGFLPTRNLAGSESVVALAAACATALVAAAAGALPPVLGLGSAAGGVFTALAAMMLRLGVVLTGGLLLVFATPLPRAPLLIWIGICHLVLMPLETRFVIRESARAAEAKLQETR